LPKITTAIVHLRDVHGNQIFGAQHRCRFQLGGTLAATLMQ
jgi:hypothetical protein